MGTIREFMDQAEGGKLILPSIQREYVWNEEQICRLFDSIMSEYPIGHMMLWKLDGSKINEKGITFYKLLNNYNEMIPENNEKLENPSPDKTYFAILDGQQRTQSLYIGLKGYLKLKIYRARKNNVESYKNKYLYINLIGEESELDEYKYEFKFFADEELKNKENENKFFFRVGKILQYDRLPNINDIENIKNIQLNDEQKRIAQDILFNLYQKINVDDSILHWDIISSDKSLDNVLNIFIRTNSGGTVLSKTDLLFSTVVANWEDARKNIEELLDRINNKGGQGVRFNFTKDFIMRTLMYLLDEPVTLKLNDIKDNIQSMRENWELLSSAISKAPSVLKYAGYNGENLISYNAVMPIIYYIYKGGFLKKTDTIDYNPMEELKKYLVIAQMKKLFGVASNNTLTNVRNALIDKNKKLRNKYFKLNDLNNVNIVGNRDFSVNDEIIESWFEENKNDYTFMILTLLYPCADIEKVKYHQDHMHPESKLKNNPKFYNLRNRLANLQLLPGDENESKNDTDLEEWLNLDNDRLKNTRYLPECSKKIEDYEIFLEERKKLMKEELLKILKIN